MKTDNKIDLSKRTKGEWKVASNYKGDEYATNILGGDYNKVLAETRFNHYFNAEEAEANAAYIVLAVNNFDKLIEALEKCKEQLETWRHFDKWNEYDSEVHKECEQLLQSIEKQQQ